VLLATPYTPPYPLSPTPLPRRPQGTFVVRPHDSQEELLYFLSFVGTEREGIKHAVVRKDLKGSDDDDEDNEGGAAGAGAGTGTGDGAGSVSGEPSPTARVIGGSSGGSSCSGSGQQQAVYVYRCGKVGPCDSLAEVLRVIAGILPSGLLLDQVQ
jgi:hypothetical protein